MTFDGEDGSLALGEEWCRGETRLKEEGELKCISIGWGGGAAEGSKVWWMSES